MPERDDFYVGYLPMPLSHRRLLLVALPLALLAMLFTGVAIALTQRDPGPATWQRGATSTWQGVLRLEPYPVLHATTGDDSNTYLLVHTGKFGARELAEPFAEQLVSIHGRLLERDGRRMIELADAPIGLASGPRSFAPFPTPTVLGVVDLRGEIIDSKCYLGAMKPGDRKTHKACAMLCLRGGITPMFVSHADDGATLLYIPLARDGSPMPEELIDLAGEPIHVTGIAETHGGLTYLRIATAERE
ncbi:MAG: hypothetical protein R3B57_06830 [Phycisphaerales bacterium]